MPGPPRRQLPPGPRLPVALQTAGWWARPTPFLERCRSRFGRRFTLRLAAQRPFVMISDPAELKEVFTAPPEVLHPGEGARILEPIVGPNSILLLDEGAHLAQRRLVLPAFAGERMAALEHVVREVAEREIASLPRDEPFPAHPAMQRLTMDVILRALFGLDPGSRYDELRDALAAMLDFGFSPVSLLPPLQRDFGGHGVWARFNRARARADKLLYDEIARRRADESDRGDVLTTLLAATHEDGSPMSDEEVHDELLTLLVAGHETTATSLAWTAERLARHPEAAARLTEEVRGGEGDEYLTAVIREALRRRPVLPTAQPRTVMQPITVGGWSYPADVHLVPCIWLTHHDPEIYPDPFAFRPERFLGVEPGTYTWLPFGGGRRRCAGANFALLEMRVVLAELLREASIAADTTAPEQVRRRGITISPAGGGTITLRTRERSRPPKPALAQPV